MNSLQRQAIIKILEELLSEEDVLVAALAMHGGSAITPERGKFKIKNLVIWSLLMDSLGQLFIVIDKFTRAGLNKLYFELGEYGIVLFVLPQSKAALLCVLPTLANRGMIEVEMENARRAILQILKGG